MGWLICLTAMAFFGLVCMTWVLAGWFFPADGEQMLFCDGNTGLQENGVIRRYQFLYGLGLIRWRLVVVDLGMCPPERHWLEHRTGSILLWTKEEYLSYLETERNRIDGTGNGNHPGRDQRRGI